MKLTSLRQQSEAAVLKQLVCSYSLYHSEEPVILITVFPQSVWMSTVLGKTLSLRHKSESFKQDLAQKVWEKAVQLRARITPSQQKATGMLL